MGNFNNLFTEISTIGIESGADFINEKPLFAILTL